MLIWLWNKLYNKLFSGKFTDAYYKANLGYRTLDKIVDVTEVFNDSDEYPETYFPRESDLPVRCEMLLSEQGGLTEGRAIFASEEDKPVISLLLKQSKQKLLFNNSSIHTIENGEFGKLLHKFNNPVMESIHYANYINEKTILMIANPEGQPHIQTHLWQVDLQSFEKRLLSGDTYYAFSRPPLVLTPSGFDGVVVAYYSEVERFGFVNHDSAPKFSVLRIYSDKFPEGIDLVEFSHEAGTIVDVACEAGNLIVITDPNRPAKYDRALRHWKISIEPLLAGRS